MKKLWSICLVAVVAALLSACAGTAAPPTAAAALEGKLVELTDNSLLIAGNEGGLYQLALPSSLYDKYNRTVPAADLAVGQTLLVGYSGDLQETYPAQLSNVSYVQITADASDLVGMYRQLFDELWQVDPGLNENIQYLAFDLSKAANLNAGEKEALIWLTSQQYGLLPLTGTFEELCDKGYIDRENLYFAHGLLWELKVTESTDNSCTFEASKWRSGLGAYFFTDCRGQKDQRGWRYTIGAEAIA